MVLLVTGIATAAILIAVVYAPAPWNLLKTRLVFSVEDLSFEPIELDGREGTHFRATIRYENLGPVRADLNLVLVAAHSVDARSTLFDTSSVWDFSLTQGESRTVAFDTPLTGSWDDALFYVKVTAHSVRVQDVLSADEPVWIDV